MARFVLFVLLLLSSPTAALAQVAVFVESTGDDPVGKRLDFALKNEIRGSNLMELTYRENEAGLKLSMVTLDPQDKGYSTVYSLSILLRNPDGFDYFLTSFVGTCGSSKVQECAQGLAEDTGVQIEEIREALLVVEQLASE